MNSKTILPAVAGLVLLSSSAIAADAVVTATKLNLRAGPDARHPMIAVMTQGAKVTHVKCDGEWCRVRYQGTFGYAVAAHLHTGGDSYASALQDAVVAQPAQPSQPQRGARIWRWDDPATRDRIVHERQLRSEVR